MAVPPPPGLSTLKSPSNHNKIAFYCYRNLAIGIGIQNFPEGLAVSLPLRGAGYSSWTSFWFVITSNVVYRDLDFSNHTLTDSYTNCM